VEYLRKVAGNGKAPYIAPIEIFERGWALWNLALTGPLDNEIVALCQPHLDFMEHYWQPGEGIAASAGLTLIDGDTTGIVYEVLTHFGRSIDLEGVFHYETDSHFRCFPLEANPSISTNIHILGALYEAGYTREQAPVQKILQFLHRTQTMRLFWFDKWHASPYYSTAHAIIACVDYDDELVDDAVYWILETQQEDGSWGYYMPTAEETAYCLQALVVWKRHGHPVPSEVLARGAAWLSEHTDSPYPSLWIGKSLYCPQVVVRSAILSALVMVEQG
jgi:halimadienyl-diphosphate synthase